MKDGLRRVRFRFPTASRPRFDLNHILGTGQSLSLGTMGSPALSTTQPYSNKTGRGTGAITGGTGRYEGAQGTFTAVGRKGSDPAVYDYTLRITTP